MAKHTEHKLLFIIYRVIVFYTPELMMSQTVTDCLWSTLSGTKQVICKKRKIQKSPDDRPYDVLTGKRFKSG